MALPFFGAVWCLSVQVCLILPRGVGEECKLFGRDSRVRRIWLDFIGLLR
jgi:hypothetical protein